MCFYTPAHAPRQEWGDVRFVAVAEESPSHRVCELLKMTGHNAVRSESRCARRVRYVDLVVSIEAAVEVCRCFTVFSC
jgi:hypothetical protein